MKNDNIDVTVETKDSRPIRTFVHEGRSYIQSKEDSVYQIRVKNQTGNRIKAVISVDSLNIVSGKPASNDPIETGYILGPYEEQIFRGFRVNDDQVAEFTFVKREKSYATEKGEGQGNGVIAVRAYEEKENETEKLKQRIKDLENRPREKEYIDRPYPVYPWRPYHWYSQPYFHFTCGGGQGMGSNAGGNSMSLSSTIRVVNCSVNTADTGLRACAAQSELAADENPFSMGSGWGDAVKDSVKMVEFEVGKLIAEITVYYAAIEGLKALGVNVDRVKAVAFPEPFKREYCAKPSGWKG